MTPEQKNWPAIQNTIAGLALFADDLFNGDKEKAIEDLTRCGGDGVTFLRLVKNLHALSPTLQSYAAARKAQAGGA